MTVMTATDRPRKKAAPLARILLGILLLLCFVSARIYAQGGGSYFLPGDAKAGMKIFFDKGCARCHAVLGEGGKAAPDLARAPSGHLSAAELVAGMWNHAPAMWEKMRSENLPPPPFSDSEMSDLFAFLYTVRSLDEPGDPERGRQLLVEKHCVDCHAVAGQGGRVGPDLRQWASYRNPVSWVQAMWNHAPGMQQVMRTRNLSWPEFRDNDVADLIAYIRTQAPNPRQHVYLRPANPESGRALFRAKGCASCHSSRAGLAQQAPRLGTPGMPRTLGQFAGLMWNHSPQMWASMQAQRVSRAQFSNQEMADLIAFLFAERYFEASGNASRGARIFENKGCASCHARSPTGPGVPLSSWRGRVSPVAVATALWNHGPVMLEHMRQQQIPWPLFAPGEVSDLMEFLNRGASPHQRKEPDK